MARLPQAVAEVLEGYLRCGGFPLRTVGSKPQDFSPAQSTRTKKAFPYNIWLWKAKGFLSAREKWLEMQANLKRANAQDFVHNHSLWAPVERGQNELELCKENPVLGALGLEVWSQLPQFPVLSQSSILQRIFFTGRQLLLGRRTIVPPCWKNLWIHPMKHISCCGLRLIKTLRMTIRWQAEVDVWMLWDFGWSASIFGLRKTLVHMLGLSKGT